MLDSVDAAALKVGLPAALRAAAAAAAAAAGVC